MLTCGIMLRGELQKLHALELIHQTSQVGGSLPREHVSISNTAMCESCFLLG